MKTSSTFFSVLFAGIWRRIRSFGLSVWRRIRHFFSGNLGLKITAILVAMFLWAYVLVVLNPVRTKTIQGVTISLEGDTDLLSRNLILVSSDMGLAEVEVSAEINNHSMLDSSRINCRGSLSSITRAGTFTLPLSTTVQSNLGTVTKVSPERITVEVDKLISRTVPVSLVFDGELPAGYEVLNRTSPASVTITGATRYIQPAVRAEAHVSLQDRTANIEESVALVFYDREGNVTEVFTRSGETPVSNVSVEVSPVKEVPVEIRYELPNAAYYDVTVTSGRESVLVYGSAQVLEGITSVKTEPIALEEKTGIQEPEADLVLPAQVTLKKNQSTAFTVVVNITEKTGVKELTVPVTYEGLDSGLTFAGEKPSSAVILLSGTVKQLELVSADSVSLQVSLTGLTEGTHELVPVIELKRSEEISSVSAALQEKSLTVTLQKKEVNP